MDLNNLETGTLFMLLKLETKVELTMPNGEVKLAELGNIAGYFPVFETYKQAYHESQGRYEIQQFTYTLVPKKGYNNE